MTRDATLLRDVIDTEHVYLACGPNLQPLILYGLMSVVRAWRKWLLFTIGAASIVLRCPRLFFEPRFWAEEGSVFFAYAFKHSALSALTRPDGGNYDLPRNLASILAVNLAPLEWAPLVTTLFAFGIQLIPLV